MKTSKRSFAPDNLETHRGFALVVTLSLLILLTVIAVGMLSLSAVTLRKGSQADARSEAQANARLALMLAIGELQKGMGPDQRVSAPGAITDPDPLKVNHPHWTGVWNSWKAGTGENSQHSTIGSAPDSALAPTYQAQRADYFRSWLLSLDPDEAPNVSSPLDVSLTGSAMPDKDANAVELVGEGSLGTGSDPNDYVSARLLPVASGASSGRYGWWIGDESQKARIMDDKFQTPATPLTSAEKIFRQQASGSTGTTTVVGLEALTDDAQLKELPSLRSLDLVTGATGKPSQNFHAVTPFSYQVLTDVREGGLKRDLSILLERPIDITESGYEFMLYKFNDKERVPIQDLSAWFQLYKQAIGDPFIGNKGVQYGSAPLLSGIQMTSPDYGNNSPFANSVKLSRQYTTLYRSPVPIKLQFMLGLQARERLAAEIDADFPDTHELYLTITVGMTFWNPTNLPLVMDNSATERLFQRIRFWFLALGIEWNKVNDGWTHGADLKYVLGETKPFVFELNISPDVPLVFAPGEVKVLSIPYDPTTRFNFTREGWFDETKIYKMFEGWDPSGFMPVVRSTQRLKPDGRGAPLSTDRNWSPHIANMRVLFTPGDQIQLTINATGPLAPTLSVNEGLRARHPFLFQLCQDSYPFGQSRFYNYTLASQDGPDWGNAEFKKSFMERGFEGNAPITIDLPLDTIIAGSSDKETWPFLSVSLMAGTETHEGFSAGGSVGGRKFASRPFLHSSAIRHSAMEADNFDAFYNYGWNWFIEPINSVLEAPVQVTIDGNNGYYGGGYGVEFGNTHIVQQEIPVVPAMSLASLSHAHLGGYSITSYLMEWPWGVIPEPEPMATGRGGLFPHTLQAVGNSYAHPLLSPEKAYDDTIQRTFRSHEPAKTVVFADHSYLANKALWDEFFFSSITPQPASAQIFETIDRSAEQVARDFFFSGKPLPNRRMKPYANGLDETTFAAMFTSAQQQQFSAGLADKIAAHLMVEGPFNVNSTSVDAWKVLLSSLKGKPVAYLENVGDTVPAVATPNGTPVGASSLANGQPTGGTSDPADAGQWTSPRELSDDEVGQLAEAIVKQVKLRGPFLSLSEFVNRRLDSSNPELAVKGALQAALDDPDVSINAGFRTPEREFSAAEKATMNPAFPEALDGPVAYGSSAYVDQADVLRNFAAQLTPRGDTFVIRTYGDSLDASGNVRARAWCEAVVQRIPDYVDKTDEAHVKQSELQSEANKRFGRKFQIVSFRWLSGSEV